MEPKIGSRQSPRGGALAGLVNVAATATATQSSLSPWSTEGEAAKALSVDAAIDFAFHTDEEDAPWWEADLGAIHPIEAIIVHNRRGDFQERARTLKIEVSRDRGEWILIHAGLTVFGAAPDSVPFEIWPGGEIEARYVRLSLTERQYLHLSGVEVHVPGTILDALGNLPETIEYTGEFGSELVLFLPYVNWLASVGLLRSRTIRTYAGMRCFYDGLAIGSFVEKPDIRIYQGPEHYGFMPVRSEHAYDNLDGPSAYHKYPDMRAKFLKLRSRAIDDITGAKPFLVVHNKYGREWDGPINFYDLAVLDQLLAKMNGKFRIIYIRHRVAARGYSEDETPFLDYADDAVLSRHPDVLDFENLFRSHLENHDLNTFKNIIFSRTFYFFSVQGGGSYQMAMFSGSFLSVLHKRGSEIVHAYAKGIYTFMCNPAPILAVCLNDAEVLESADAALESSLIAGRVGLSGDSASLMARLSPVAQRARYTGLP